MKIAVPVDYGRVSAHFGRATDFVIVHVENEQIKKREFLEPPPHEPSALPKWLHELGVTVIIARGMGKRARELLREKGMKVVTGVLGGGPEQLVEQYLANTLVTGKNLCDH
jgi:predicted Fe-Mo cluster-binding NifX family protein